MPSSSSSSSALGLRQRRGSKTTLSPLNELQQSITESPILDGSDGQPTTEVTAIPGPGAPTAEKTKEPQRSQSLRSDSYDSSDNLSHSSSHSIITSLATETETADPPNKAMSGSQVAKDESRMRKIIVRAASGAGMIGVFCGCVYMGHLYVCLIVAASEFLLFRELVKVRYSVYFNTIQDTIPLFRTTQWMWFFVAIVYTYGDFASEVIQNNSHLHYLWSYAQYFSVLAFLLYSATFVLTIATMQTGHIKFQLNQLCWTIVVLCWTFGQMKYIMHNIFNGLFWFTFPFLLVVVNDIMAYFSGITCGRKFIQRPFIRFSPNKTWEGFIGGGIFTMVAAWYLSRTLAQYSWMTCPTNEFRVFPGDIECTNHHIFQPAQSVISQQIFEVLPASLVKMIPGIVEICSVKNSTSAATATADSAAAALTRCISGERTHVFHHFELVLKSVYPIQIHALWLGFFASVVAPFGGFLASAIKRAYGIKDFDSLIPGHGGVTDRLDCQFLMALCTWVHYNSFVRMATVSVPKLVYMYHMLSEDEQRAFVEELTKTAGRQMRKRLEDYSF